MQVAPVKPGDVLAGKYRVERVLGQGGMGVVVAARQLDLDRLVALKFIIPQRGAEEIQLARFMAEARAASKLQSEHVGRIHDVGKLDDGAPYLVMELLDGKDLAAALRERGGLPVDDALLYVLQAAHAVAEAHNFGIVHRDLKPADLFLTWTAADEPLVKVLDFGVSKPAHGEERMTRTGEMLGSPAYMSPEQIKASREVDARSDVWSLGVILYELLAGPGVTPFKGGTTYELMMKIAMEEPTSLAKHRPDLPRGLISVVMACFEKDKLRRYASVSHFVSALAPYVPASAASYVKQIATIQFSQQQPERRTDKLPEEPASAKGAAQAPASAAPAGSAPSPWGEGSAGIEAPAEGPAGASRQLRLAVIVTMGSVVLAALAAGIAIGRARSSPDAPARDVDAKPPGSVTASLSAAPSDSSRGRDEDAAARRAPGPAPEAVPSGAASGMAPGMASASRGTGKDAPSTRAAPAKPAAPAPPGSPKDRSAFDL
jgi:serine/threonine-protein kinase